MPELYCGDGEVSLRCLKFLEIANSRLQCFEPIGQEIRMFHEASGLCGTLDFLAYHKERKEYWVVDWKSNKVIRTDNDRCYGNMLGEFSDLKDNEHNVYSLQISLYRLFLKSVGITTAGGIIVHLPTNTTPPAIYKTIDHTHRISTLTSI